MKKTGLLLVNLGTPKSTELRDIKSYLREFLSDPRVIDIADLARFLLVNLIIVPFRSKKSQHMYKEIWRSDNQSPILYYGNSLALKLNQKIGDRVVTKLAMRYQYPSIESCLDQFHNEGIDDIIVFPLFPQYASATYGSVIDKVFSLAGKKWNTPFLKVMSPYYAHDSYLQAVARVAQESEIKEFNPDLVLFSYHGLPERHCQKSAMSNACSFSDQCCLTPTIYNRNCYRHQCFMTTKGVMGKLDLGQVKASTVFQSQFGKDKWIEPYLEEELMKAAKSGVKRIAVFSPSFVADCLETIEEIGIRARETFLSHGGEELKLIPCLNDHDIWVDSVIQIASL